VDKGNHPRPSLSEGQKFLVHDESGTWEIEILEVLNSVNDRGVTTCPLRGVARLVSNLTRAGLESSFRDHAQLPFDV
jgi:hypothetical protein